jgi:GTP:adenosylcobinamide-phosphate guanylyltransferase
MVAVDPVREGPRRVGVLLGTGAPGASSADRREVPLLPLGAELVLERLRSSLLSAGLDEAVVATSPQTPETSRYCQEHSIPWVAVPGEGYAADVAKLATRFPRFLTVRADRPFLRPGTLAPFVKRAVSGVGVRLTGILPEALFSWRQPRPPAWPHELPGLGRCGEAGIEAYDGEPSGPAEPFLFLDPWLAVRVQGDMDPRLLAEWARGCDRGDPAPGSSLEDGLSGPQSRKLGRATS